MLGLWIIIGWLGLLGLLVILWDRAFARAETRQRRTAAPLEQLDLSRARRRQVARRHGGPR